MNNKSTSRYTSATSNCSIITAAKVAFVVSVRSGGVECRRVHPLSDDTRTIDLNTIAGNNAINKLNILHRQILEKIFAEDEHFRLMHIHFLEQNIESVAEGKALQRVCTKHEALVQAKEVSAMKAGKVRQLEKKLA